MTVDLEYSVAIPLVIPQWRRVVQCNILHIIDSATSSCSSDSIPAAIAMDLDTDITHSSLSAVHGVCNTLIHHDCSLLKSM